MMSHCCTASCVRGLYYAWYYGCVEKPGQVNINLLLNRGSQSLDVDSYLPYEGKVRLNIKKDTFVNVRIPKWVDNDKVIVFKNDQPCEFSWANGCLTLVNTHAGDTFLITFPMKSRTVKETIAKKEYTITYKGNTVISISPQGAICPLYNRKHFLGATQMKSITYYLPDHTIQW